MKHKLFLILFWACMSFSLQAQNYSGGSGTVADPYQIASAADLYYLRQNFSSQSNLHFIQTANIANPIIDASNYSSYLGDFSGTYNGDGHTITGLSPLFNNLSSNAVVTNLGLINDEFNIYASGGLANFNNGTISNCYIIITESIFYYDIVIGGLVGINHASGIIQNCYTNVLASGQNEELTAGFAVENYGFITNCYSTGTIGSIGAPNEIGNPLNSASGFVGYNWGIISNSYAACVVYARHQAAIFCLSNSGSITNCFYDNEVNGEFSYDYSSAIPKTTAEMQTQSTFTTAGWDFTTVWGAMACYPTLLWENKQTLVVSAVSQTNLVCNGGTTGSATVLASGGTGTYAYSWSPSGGSAATASGLSAGTYTCTVTDTNNCTASQSFTITQPDPITITGVTSIGCTTCSDGTIDITVTGGTPPYHYAWGNEMYTFYSDTEDVSGLIGGTYNVHVYDANSCVATQSFTIMQPATHLHNGSFGDFNFSNSSNLKPTSQITIEGMVKSDDPDAAMALLNSGRHFVITNKYDFAQYGESLKGYGIAVGHGIYNNGLRTRFSLDVGTTTNSSELVIYSGIPLDMQWHHVAMTYDGRYLKVYMDGALVETQDAGGDYPIVYDDNTFTRIVQDRGQFNQDELRIWNFAKTQSEILAQKDCELPSDQTGLLAYYNFNQGNNDDYVQQNQLLIDSSGNNNHGVASAYEIGIWEAGSVMQTIVAPTVTTPVAYHLGNTATALTATLDLGTTGLLWYTSATGGTGSTTAPTPTTTTLGTTSYWVTSTNSLGCESTRVQIDVYVTNVQPDNNNVLYVDKDATGTGLGNSWTNAVTELADALKYAKQHENGNNWATTPLQIWVAEGTYKPLYTPRDGALFIDENRNNSFLMVNNVQVYGGFVGTETTLSQRNFTTNITTLSGDIGIVDDTNDNIYNVVVSSGATGLATLDGFTITNGHANAYLDIVVNNNQIYKCSGAGIYNSDANPNYKNLILINNTCTESGGGMFNYMSSPELKQVKIKNNSAKDGGGIASMQNSMPVLINTAIENNMATEDGGGMYNVDSSTATLYNVTLAGNESLLYNSGIQSICTSFTTASNVLVNNSIIMDDVSGFFTAQYSLIKDHSNTTNGNVDATNFIATDVFADPVNGDFSLKTTSPAMNAGDNSLYEGADGNTSNNSLATDTDLLQNPRIFDGSPITDIIDLGAYEYKAIPATNLNFDGINDRIDCGNNTSLQITGQNITLEAWVKINTFANEAFKGNIINKEDNDSDSGYMLRVGGNGNVNFNLGNESWHELFSPDNSVQLNTWHHLAATYDGLTMKIYVDGIMVANSSDNLIINNAASNLFIGDWHSGGRNFNGSIDEVRVWNIARTDTQIIGSRSCELQGNETGLVAYYKFNQGFDSVDNTNITTLTDATANANNGTVTNFALNGITSNWLAGSPITTGNAIPATPTTLNDTQDFCASDNPTLSNIQINETNILWYDAASGGNLIAPTTALTNGNYYAAAQGTSCESAERLQVTVTIISNPATPTTTNASQIFCASDNPTVANIQVNETNILWYDAASDGNLIATTTSLVNGNYYAAAQGTSCESVERLQVTVTISNPATPTTTNASQIFCASDNPTVANIQVNETNVLWYDAASGGNLIAPTTALTNGSYYAAIQDALTGCEGQRSLIDVTVVATPIITLQPQNTTVSETESVVFTVAGTNAISYQWQYSYDNGANWHALNDSFTNPNVSGSTTNTLTISGTDLMNISGFLFNVIINGDTVCSTTSNSAMATITLGANSFDRSNLVSIYPNPSNGIYTIETNQDIKLEVYDMIGKFISKKDVLVGSSTLDLLNYADGVYLVKVTNTAGDTKTYKVVKRN